MPILDPNRKTGEIRVDTVDSRGKVIKTRRLREGQAPSSSKEVNDAQAKRDAEARRGRPQEPKKATAPQEDTSDEEPLARRGRPQEPKKATAPQDDVNMSDSDDDLPKVKFRFEKNFGQGKKPAKRHQSDSPELSGDDYESSEDEVSNENKRKNKKVKQKGTVQVKTVGVPNYLKLFPELTEGVSVEVPDSWNNHSKCPSLSQEIIDAIREKRRNAEIKSGQSAKGRSVIQDNRAEQPLKIFNKHGTFNPNLKRDLEGAGISNDSINNILKDLKQEARSFCRIYIECHKFIKDDPTTWRYHPLYSVSILCLDPKEQKGKDRPCDYPKLHKVVNGDEVIIDTSIVNRHYDGQHNENGRSISREAYLRGCELLLEYFVTDVLGETFKRHKDSPEPSEEQREAVKRIFEDHQNRIEHVLSDKPITHRFKEEDIKSIFVGGKKEVICDIAKPYTYPNHHAYPKMTNKKGETRAFLINNGRGYFDYRLALARIRGVATSALNLRKKPITKDELLELRLLKAKYMRFFFKYIRTNRKPVANDPVTWSNLKDLPMNQICKDRGCRPTSIFTHDGHVHDEEGDSERRRHLMQVHGYSLARAKTAYKRAKIQEKGKALLEKFHFRPIMPPKEKAIGTSVQAIQASRSTQQKYPDLQSASKRKSKATEVTKPPSNQEELEQQEVAILQERDKTPAPKSPSPIIDAMEIDVADTPTQEHDEAEIAQQISNLENEAQKGIKLAFGAEIPTNYSKIDRCHKILVPATKTPEDLYKFLSLKGITEDDFLQVIFHSNFLDIEKQQIYIEFYDEIGRERGKPSFNMQVFLLCNPYSVEDERVKAGLPIDKETKDEINDFLEKEGRLSPASSLEEQAAWIEFVKNYK